MKATLIGLGVLFIVAAGFFALDAYVDIGNHAEEESSPLATYFYEQMMTVGVADIGQPIEGFDAFLLIMAYPGLMPEDFEGVETLEGHYEIEEGEIVFIRDQAQPISSAERAIPEEGYATLLENVSARLNMPADSEAAIDAIIERINTGERIETRIDEGGSALGVKVTPHEVLEDSRCPVDVVCVQAGVVRVRATLESGLGTTTDQVFVLEEPVTTEAEEVTLVQVAPVPESGVDIAPADYVFYFLVQKRPAL